MKHEHMKRIIDQFLKKTISPEDLNTLKEWVLKKENEVLFRDYISQYYRNYTHDIDKAFERFEGNVLNQRRTAPKRRERQFTVLKYAAVLVGIGLTTFAVYQYTGDPIELNGSEITLEMEDGSFQTIKESEVHNIVTATGMILGKQNGNQLSYGSSSNNDAKITYNTLRVPYGKRFQIKLSDDSYVYLNAGSSLKYPVQFIEGKSREVVLEGEAYFKISKNKDWPFIVRTNTMNTEVFGTEFNISSYSEDEKTSVVLVEGSIGVFEKGVRFDSKSDILLTPSQMASKSFEKPIGVSSVDISSHIAWVNGTLLFRNERFSTIINKLQRHYDVSITNYYESLEEKRFTGRFDIENIEEVLNAFQKMNDFNYVIQENNIVINP